MGGRLRDGASAERFLRGRAESASGVEHCMRSLSLIAGILVCGTLGLILAQCSGDETASSPGADQGDASLLHADDAGDAGGGSSDAHVTTEIGSASDADVTTESAGPGASDSSVQIVDAGDASDGGALDGGDGEFAVEAGTDATDSGTAGDATDASDAGADSGGNDEGGADASDEGTDGPQEAACPTLVDTAPSIIPTSNSEAPPVFSGGTVSGGTYFATSVTGYNGGACETGSLNATFVVTPATDTTGSYVYVDEFAGIGTFQFSGTYTISGATFTTTEPCSTLPGDPGMSTRSFTASAGPPATITLLDTPSNGICGPETVWILTLQ